MFRKAITVLLVLVSHVALGRENRYPVDSIPAHLLKNAHAVVREHKTSVNILSPSEIKVTYRYAVTVMDEKGIRCGNFSHLRNNYIEINGLEGALYDRNGKQLKRLNKKYADDFGISADALADDNYFKHFDFNHRSYPYTCEYDVEVTYKQSFYLPGWQPQDNFDCSVQSAELEVVYPKNIVLKHYIFKPYAHPEVKSTEEGYRLTASVSNLSAVERPDYFSSTRNYNLQAMAFAIPDFEIEQRRGNMGTWKRFGSFFYDLNANRDILPLNVKNAVHTLTDTCHSDVEKISLLYKYLKQSTRYVSIQLGIGGYQTFDAKYVAEKGYGDCKALSNYMMSMLKEVGITSYLTLAHMGTSDMNMDLDFPYNQFNHMILTVPRMYDTIWLECTSKTLPVGYLGSSTSGKRVLMTTPDGGYPLMIPGNKQNDNLLTRKADVYLNDKDEITGTLSLSHRGYFWEQEAGMVVDQPKTDVDNYMNSRFMIGSYSVKDYKVTNKADLFTPQVDETATLSGEATVARSGNNAFVKPSVFKPAAIAPVSYEPRIDSFQLHQPYIVLDTVILHFPSSFQLEPPKEVFQEYPFARYRYIVTQVDDHTARLITNYSFNAGTYAPALFADYIKLYRQMNSDAARKLVLRKKE